MNDASGGITKSGERIVEEVKVDPGFHLVSYRTRNNPLGEDIRCRTEIHFFLRVVDVP